MTRRWDELLSWSLFELSTSDEQALHELSRLSWLRPLPNRSLNTLQSELNSGNRVALSFRDVNTQAYHGLCVFGVESPSPADDKGLALFVLSTATYSPQDGITTPQSAALDEDLLKRLLEELLRFCRTHGYTRIQCYVADDAAVVASLVSEGFKFEAALSSREGRMFGLSRQLPATYTGDPYDGHHFLRWLAEELRLTVVSDDDTSIVCELHLTATSEALASTRLGEVVVPVEMTLERQRTDRLRIAFGSTQAGGVYSQLADEDLKALAQMPRLNMTLWPPPTNGAGIVVEIRRDLFDTFPHDGSGAYFDSGSYGTLLERGLENGVRPMIFFIDFETTAENPRLIGCARVDSVHRDPPEKLWSDWGSISSWRNKDAFTRYRSIKRKMTAIIFSELKTVDVVGPGLPFIGHSWTYVESEQAYRVARRL